MWLNPQKEDLTSCHVGDFLPKSKAWFKRLTLNPTALNPNVLLLLKPYTLPPKSLARASFFRRMAKGQMTGAELSQAAEEITCAAYVRLRFRV